MLPNFLIIGAAKSGTTALYRYLKQHPDIYMSPVKETNFFALENQTVNFQGPGDEITNQNSITNWGDYEALFDEAEGYRAIGEASPLYLYRQNTAERIADVLPDVKLIVILRDPVARAHSAYFHLRRDERETIPDFATAVREEARRIEQNWAPMWHYLSRGYYYRQLQPYLQRFAPEQLLILFHEDLDEEPNEVCQQIFRFLNVDASFQPNTAFRPNVSGIPRSSGLHHFLTQPSAVKQLIKPLLPTKVRERLAESVRQRNLVKNEVSNSLRHQLQKNFKADIHALEKLTNRDLSSWLV